jgi:hypothetical protein
VARSSVIKPVVSCGKLRHQSFSGAGAGSTNIVNAANVSRGKLQQCSVTGQIGSVLDFNLRLPTKTYKGQYLQEGCSGYCGAVDIGLPESAVGCPSFDKNQLAVAADDEGHETGSFADTSFGSNAAERAAFASTSEHTLAVVAKAIIAKFYGHRPTYSYFDGCSDGGREALNEAEKYPADFNGILTGAPEAFAAELDGEFEAWLIASNTSSGGQEILTSAQLPALHKAVLKACGNAAGYVVDPRTCDFQPSSLACPTGTITNSCLTPAQVTTVTDFYKGPVDSTGESLYPGGEPYGSELAWLGWMIDAASDTNWPGDTQAYYLAAGYLKDLAYPIGAQTGAGTSDPNAISQLQFTLAEYQQVTQLSNMYNSIDPNLSKFAHDGGKIILYHGWADEAIPPFGTVLYYGAVVADAGGFSQSQRFSRLYMVPGQYHCLLGGSPAVYSDLLNNLIDWVQQAKKPATVSFPLVQPRAHLKQINVRPLNPISQPLGALGLNSSYNWVGSFPN